MNEAEAWTDFYVTAGASAAVLIGLLFVALSINRETIARHAHLGGQARQALSALIAVFVVPLRVLIPDQSAVALGPELIVGASVLLALAMPRQVRRVRATVPAERRGFALLVAVYDGAGLFVFAGGVTLAASGDFAFTLLAVAVIAFALLAILNSWRLTLVAEGL